MTKIDCHTERGIDVLRDLANLGILSPPQIAEKHFWDRGLDRCDIELAKNYEQRIYRRATREISRLKRSGYVGSRLYQAERTKNCGYYFIKTKGLDALDFDPDRNRYLYKRSRKLSRAGYGHVIHRLYISQFFINLWAITQDWGDKWLIEEWKSEPVFKTTESYRDYVLRPDGYCVLSQRLLDDCGCPDGRERACFFLEIDNDTEGYEQLTERFKQYYQVHRMGCYENDFKLPDIPYLLVVTPHNRRMESIRSLIEKIAEEVESCSFEERDSLTQRWRITTREKIGLCQPHQVEVASDRMLDQSWTSPFNQERESYPINFLESED